LLADAVTIGIPAAQKVGSTALLSPENAGPIVAMTDEFVVSAVAAAGAVAAAPSLSCASSLAWKPLLAAFHWEMASVAPCFSLMPSCALPPDSAPMKPIV
jgi:hypothetical protein